MSIVVNASELTLNDLHDRFALNRITDPAFFPEWCQDLTPLTEMEQLLLDRVQQNFLDQLAARFPFREALPTIIEETVNVQKRFNCGGVE
jgi:hypothetical protein